MCKGISTMYGIVGSQVSTLNRTCMYHNKPREKYSYK